MNIEHNLHDLHARLMRTEESNSALSSKCLLLSESLNKCHQVRNISSLKQNTILISGSG